MCIRDSLSPGERHPHAAELDRHHHLSLRLGRVRRRAGRPSRVLPGGSETSQTGSPRPPPRRAATREHVMNEKILAEHRRDIGGFEIVDIVDEQQIANLRSKLDVDVPLDLHWTWEYGSEVEELRALYERGKKGQWNAEEDVDWSIPLERNEWFMPREGASLLSSVLTQLGADEATCRDAAWDEFSHLISQLLHGEQAAPSWVS